METEIWLVRHGQSVANAGLPTDDPAAIPLTDADTLVIVPFTLTEIPMPAAWNELQQLVSRAFESGTWWERQLFSAGWPSISAGQVQPLGERRIIMGQRGRLISRFNPAWRLISRISPITFSITLAMRWCISSGSSPSTK